MKTESVIGTILGLLVLLWLGGWALGIVRHLVHHLISLAILVGAILLIARLATARKV